MTGGTAMVESMHGAGSPQAQRIMIFREGKLDEKIKLAKALAGIPQRSKKAEEKIAAGLPDVIPPRVEQAQQRQRSAPGRARRSSVGATSSGQPTLALTRSMHWASVSSGCAGR
jgi:hypothetical protein